MGRALLENKFSDRALQPYRVWFMVVWYGAGLDHGPYGLWTMEYGPDHGPWTVDHGPWTVDHGPWTMDYGLWTMDYGPWTMD